MAGLLVIGLLALSSTAGALPPAGDEALNVTVEVSISSRLGEETITLTGIAGIERDDPQMDGGVDVERLCSGNGPSQVDTIATHVHERTTRLGGLVAGIRN